MHKPVSNIGLVGPLPPPNGGMDKVDRSPSTGDIDITMTLEFPPGMGEPFVTGAFLYPDGLALPISGAPLFPLNFTVPLTDTSPGIRPLTFPANLPAHDFPRTYTLVLAVYIAGSVPIPVAGVDYNLAYQLTIEDATTDIVIPGILPLLVVEAVSE